MLRRYNVATVSRVCVAEKLYIVVPILCIYVYVARIYVVGHMVVWANQGYNIYIVYSIYTIVYSITLGQTLWGCVFYFYFTIPYNVFGIAWSRRKGQSTPLSILYSDGAG